MSCLLVSGIHADDLCSGATSCPPSYDFCSGATWCTPSYSDLHFTRYIKGAFRQYTDASYSTPVPQPEYLGILGPLISLEPGDTLVVVFQVRQNDLMLCKLPVMIVDASDHVDEAPHSYTLKIRNCKAS
jgi:hypothetical protein